MRYLKEETNWGDIGNLFLSMLGLGASITAFGYILLKTIGVI